MAINQARVEAMLKAIADKNYSEIVGKQTYVPSLGNVYNLSTFNSWLDKRRVFVEKARDSGEFSILMDKNITYYLLSASRKAMADKIMAGERVLDQTEADWESLFKIRLYAFLTGK